MRHPVVFRVLWGRRRGERTRCACRGTFDGVAASLGPVVRCKLAPCRGNGRLEGPRLTDPAHVTACAVSYVHMYAHTCMYMHAAVCVR